jgi:hypothetical protein
LRGGFEREHQEGLDAILKLAQAWDATLIIRQHPHDGSNTEAQYVEAMKQAGVGGLVTRQHGNYTLRAADVLIAQGPSNVCVDAAIAGVPSAYIQTSGFDFAHALPYRADAAEIGEAAHRAIESREDPAWGGFAQTYNDAHPHGGATERAVEQVMELCR